MSGQRESPADPPSDFGSGLAVLGDVDGDGWRDIAVSAPNARTPQSAGTGAVYLFSGKAGRLVETLRGDANSRGLGSALVACGDADGDGTGDLLVGAAREGAVHVVSGGTARSLGQVRLQTRGSGLVLCDLGVRVTGSNRELGVLVGHPAFDGGEGAVSIQWIRPGTPSWTIRVEGQATGVAHTGFGRSVAATLPWDGASPRSRIAVGTPLLESGEAEGGVTLFSGNALSEVARVHGEGGAESLGSRVVAAGDIDADGVGDFFVTAFRWSHPRDLVHAGRVIAVSGAQGKVLWIVHGSAADERLGFALGRTDDWDEDGLDDIVVGSPGATPGGAVRVLSSRTGKICHEFRGIEGSIQFGFRVNAECDLDGDGRADLLVTSLSPGGGQSRGQPRVEVLLNRASNRHLVLTEP